MELSNLYELQFTSFLVKDAENVIDEELGWNTICFCSSESDLKNFVRSLELIDSFRSKLCSSPYSDDLVLVTRYRYIPVDKKLLLL